MWNGKEIPIDLTKKIEFAPLSSKDMDKIMQNLILTDQVERHKPKSEGSLIPWILILVAVSSLVYFWTSMKI